MNRNAFLLSLLLLSVYAQNTGAQTCSVNAGVNSSICVTGTMNLTGNASGALSSTPAWAQVSGPNTATITSPTSSSTTVTGFIAGTYIFRYHATCSDAASVSDSVTIIVNAVPAGFTAGADTIACGTSCTLNATLPAGMTGLWSYYLPPAPNSASGASFSSPTSKNSTLFLTSYGDGCPKTVNAVWTVTQGACSAQDTVSVAFRAQSTLGTPVPDASICGTSFSPSDIYYYGCGGTLSFTQLAGPGIATITPTPSDKSYSFGNFTNLSTGTYTFTAASTPACSGSVFRDTFKVTVGSTVAVTNPSVPGKTLCPAQFDSVYYFTPTISLLPGETMKWNLTPTGTYTPGSTVTAPVADTIGSTLRLRNVVHPDTNARTPYWYYVYSYTVSNGTCSQTYSAGLYLSAPMGNKSYMPVVNLPCAATSGNIAIPVYGTNVGYNFSTPTVLSAPPGAPAPTFTITTGTSIIASGLKPGKYKVKFDYYRYFMSCIFRTAVVEVNVSAPAGLSNAGTDQLLPCGVDSTTLAGNVPPAGQTGTWQLVSGPSGLVLTNPNSASLVIKNLLPGVYTLRWSISNGGTCHASANDMNVIVTPDPPLAAAGTDRSVCYGYKTALNGNTPGMGATGRWRQISGPAVSITDTTAAATFFTGSIAGTVYAFTWTLSNPCGVDTDTVVITTGASAGPSDAAITTADTCITSSSATLTAIAPVSGTGAWSQLSGPGAATITSPASSSTTVTGLTGGVYLFTWKVFSPGCDTLSDTVSVAYRTGTLTANAGPDQYVCRDTITLGATSPAVGTGTWTQFGGPGSTIADVHNPATGVSHLTGGSSYDYIWTVSLGVCPAARDSVHVGTFVPPSAAAARNDTLICGHTQAASSAISLALTAATPTEGSGAWLFIQTPYYGGSIANAGLPGTTASVYGGLTKIVWEVRNGACPVSRDTVNFEIVPRADAGPATYNLCEGVAHTLQGTQAGNGTVLWSQVSGPAPATITNPANPSATVTGLLTGTYKFRYDVTNPAAAACSSFDTIVINNSVRPLANAGRDTVFCYNPSGSVLYLIADTPALGTGVWSRNAGAGTVTYSPRATANPTRATVSASGLHQFRWTVTNGGCTAVDYKDVSVEQLSVPPIVFSPTTACNDSFSVSVSSPYSNFNYAWSFQRARVKDTSGINLTGPIANYFLVSDTNSIYLTITNPVTACTAKDSTAVIVNCSYLPLPLQLLSFDAAVEAYSVKLVWVTANERYIKLFDIERSPDGREWTKIGSVNAGAKAGGYTFFDRQPLAAINLYRLRIEELDGTYSYSPVRMIRLGEQGEQSLIIYPNPATEQLVIVPQGQAKLSQYELIHATGQVLSKGTLLTGAPNTIDVSAIVSGACLLKINTDGVVQVRHVQIIH